MKRWASARSRCWRARGASTSSTRTGGACWPRSTRSSPIRRRSTNSAAPRRSRSSARRATTCPSRACRRWTTGCRTNGCPRNTRAWASTSRAIRSTTTCAAARTGVKSLAEVDGRGRTRAARRQDGGSVAGRQERKSARGNRFAFVQLSDPSGLYEVTVFSETLEAARDLLEPGQNVVLTVQANMEADQLKLLATSAAPVDAGLARAGRSEIRVFIEAPEAACRSSRCSNATATTPRCGGAARSRCRRSGWSWTWRRAAHLRHRHRAGRRLADEPAGQERAAFAPGASSRWRRPSAPPWRAAADRGRRHRAGRSEAARAKSTASTDPQDVVDGHVDHADLERQRDERHLGQPARREGEEDRLPPLAHDPVQRGREAR
jgi:hypothetical protein